MSKHTAGPWEIGKCKEGAAGIWTKDGHIADVFYEAELKLENDKEAHANARLIAAAPDLLQACKEALVRLGRLGAELDIDGNHEPGSCEISNFIRAAIAKAEGELT